MMARGLLVPQNACIFKIKTVKVIAVINKKGNTNGRTGFFLRKK